MMNFPNISVILCTIFLCYIAHSIYTLVKLFKPPECSTKPCFHSYLESTPKLQLALFISAASNPLNSEVVNIKSIKQFDYYKEYKTLVNMDIPLKTRRNGTLFLHVVLSDVSGNLDWKSIRADGPTVIQRNRISHYEIPKANMYNLLVESDTTLNRKEKSLKKPVTHIQTKIYVTILTEQFTMSIVDVPPELARHVRVNSQNQFLPILQADFLKSRQQDLQEISSKTTNITLEFNYAPIGVGKFKLLAHLEQAMQTLEQMGFSKKDLDEVKGIFSDTNLYLLCGTVFIGSVHMLFDFLAFKNDILFWKRRKSYAGLSAKSILWCAFSQIVIFLYLLNEDTSLIVLIPAGIGTVIELWKTKKIFRLQFFKKLAPSGASFTKAEDDTRLFDEQAMKYLSYLLYPLCICGAAYSLIQHTHKSWYSWTINSLVNGVYAFGFLFMLPQLFINYKLKSVATLPWRTLMYKAFNTFIDDIFAFIITMPTSHRIACFRDDIVFILYLYQRWLYPVDSSRLDESTSILENVDDLELMQTNSQSESKKLK